MLFLLNYLKIDKKMSCLKKIKNKKKSAFACKKKYYKSCFIIRLFNIKKTYKVVKIKKVALLKKIKDV